MNPPPTSLFSQRTPFALATAPPPPVQQLPAPAPLPQARSENDVQWIVGWVRDLLVIAMAVANLAHMGGGH